MSGVLTTFLSDLDALRMRGGTTADAAYRELAAIIARGQTITDAVRAYESKTAARIAVPFFEVTATVSTIEDFIDAYYADLDYPMGLFAALREAATALFSLHYLRRAFVSQAMGTGGKTDVFIPGPEPLIAYRIHGGDTLERIALTTLGSIERIWEILALNDMEYPYLATDRNLSQGEFAAGAFAAGEFALTVRGDPDRTGVATGVRVPGEILWLPSDAQVPKGGENDVRDAELWGRDLALPDGLVAFDPNGELLTVEGTENIVQALRQRIGTMRGELLFHPSYGMEQFLAVGIEATRDNVLVSGLEVARTTLQDPRVVRVLHLDVLFQDTTNRAGVTLELIGAGARALPLNLVIPETISVA